jgi:uncharacterized protein YlzI (FlbEa/FlbD family)
MARHFLNRFHAPKLESFPITVLFMIAGGIGNDIVVQTKLD